MQGIVPHDGGCFGPQPAKYTGPAYLPQAGFPWYRPPLIVTANADNSPSKAWSTFTRYNTEVNSGPAWSGAARAWWPLWPATAGCSR